MAIAVKTTAALVKVANPDAVVFKFTVGTGGVTAGAIVANGTDGVVLCDGSATTAYAPLGISLETVAAGGKVAVVTHGPVEVFTGAAEGSEVYPVDGTAGAPSHTASTKKWSVGVAMNETKCFVRPIYIA